MSLFTSLTTKIAASSLLVVGGVGGFVTLAASNPTLQKDIANVQTAITNKDLPAYKSAKLQLNNDKSAARASEINATTQDQLNTLAERTAKQKATQEAITNKDYNAFTANADQKMLSRVNSQAEFDKLVVRNSARVDRLNKESEAIKNNDFNAYKSAVQLAEKNEVADDNSSHQKSGIAPTDAQIQSRFDKQVAQYKADGTLPNSNNGIMLGGRGHRGGLGGDGMGGKDSRGGRNRGQNNTAELNPDAQSPITSSAAVPQK
jgi:hypothetical protein